MKMPAQYWLLLILTFLASEKIHNLTLNLDAIFKKKSSFYLVFFCEFTIEFFLRRYVDVAVKLLWYWYLYWDDTLAHMRSASYWCRAYEQKSCLASKTTFTVQTESWMIYIYTPHNKTKQNPGTLLTLIERYSLEGRVLDMYHTIAILLQLTQFPFSLEIALFFCVLFAIQIYLACCGHYCW
jgi:hypothetical protein